MPLYYIYPQPSGNPSLAASTFDPDIWLFNTGASKVSGLITNQDGFNLGVVGAVGTVCPNPYVESGISYIDDLYPGNTTDYIRFHRNYYYYESFNRYSIQWGFPKFNIPTDKVFWVKKIYGRCKYRILDTYEVPINVYFLSRYLADYDRYPLGEFTHVPYTNTIVSGTNSNWQLLEIENNVEGEELTLDSLYFADSYIKNELSFRPIPTSYPAWFPTVDISYAEIILSGEFLDGIPFNSTDRHPTLFPLYINGPEQLNNYTDLNTTGHLTNSGEQNLYVGGTWPSGILELSTSGVWPNNQTDLYTRGYDDYNDSVDLSIPWSTPPGVYGVLDNIDLFTKYGYARFKPDCTYTNNGWSGLPDNIDLHNNIDEKYINDNDYVYYPDVSDSPLHDRDIKFCLSDISGVIDKTETHTLSVRSKVELPNDIITLRVSLSEGLSPATTIVSEEFLLTDEYQTFEHTLSTLEKNSISDYNDLYLQLQAVPYTSVNSSNQLNVSWAELEIGSDSLGGYNDSVNLFTSAADTINTDPTGLPLVTSGIFKTTDSLDLLLQGGGKSAGINLFLQGENYKSLTDTVNLYIQNDFESDPSGTFPLTINSSYKDNSYLNMVVKGPTVDDVTTYMNLYTGGYSWQSKSGIQDLSISGDYFSTLPSGVWNDSISMIMPGSFKYNTYMNLYTRGLGPQNETDIDNSPTLNLMVSNFLEKSGELDLNLLGGGYSAGMNLYLKALDGTPTNSGVDLTVWGTNNSGLFGTFDIYMNGSNAPSGVMNLYTAGTPQTFTDNSNMNIFLKGIGNLDGSITKTADIDFTLYNAWQTAEQSGLDMIVVTRSGTEGAVPVSGNMNLYLSRTEGMSHQFPLAMLGPDSTTDMVDLYLNGTPNHRDNVSLYISGIEVKNDFMRLYVNGT